jgi:hypothetical protein
VDLREAEVADQVLDVVGDDGDGGGEFAAAHLAGDGAERWAVEVVHVRVGEEDRVDGRQVADAEAWVALTAENNQTRGEDGVDEQRAAGGLDEERGVPDEGDGGVAGGDGGRELGFAEEGLFVTLADEAPKLAEFSDGEREGARHIYRNRCGDRGKGAERCLFRDPTHDGDRHEWGTGRTNDFGD